MSRATDTSNLQRPITTDDLARLRANGFDLALFGCQYPGAPYPPGDAHLDFLSAEIDGVMKVMPYFEDTPVAEAWPHIASFATMPNFVKAGAVAIEDGSGFTDLATINEQFDALRALGLQPVAYTSVYMLTKYGLLDAAKQWVADGVIFWMADYDGDMNLIVNGWDGPVWAKQEDEHGDAGLGMEVDISYYEVLPAKEDAMALIPLTDTQKAMLAVAVGDDKNGIFEAHWPDITNGTNGFGLNLGTGAPAGSKRVIIDVPDALIPS